MAVDAPLTDPSPPLLVPGNPRGVPLHLAQEPEMRGTRARFPPGPLQRHWGLEVLTLSHLVLFFSQTLLHPPGDRQRSDGSGNHTCGHPGCLPAVCGLYPCPLPFSLNHLGTRQAQLPPSPHISSSSGQLPYPTCPAGLARMDGVEMHGLL